MLGPTVGIQLYSSVLQQINRKELLTKRVTSKELKYFLNVNRYMREYLKSYEYLQIDSNGFLCNCQVQSPFHIH